MQPSRNKLKIPVLIIFILLISGFVAYRSGAMDDFFKRSNGTIDKNEADLNVSKDLDTDTLPHSKAISGSATFSSSKSIVLTDKQMKKIRKLDSILRVRNKKFLDSAGPEKIIFSGSKSGRVIELNPEIFIIDTSKKKQ